MDDYGYGKRGSIAALWCALVGVLMAAALAAPLGLFDALVWPYTWSFSMALTVLFVSALVLGDWAGRVVLSNAWSGVWTGWFLAVTCLILTALAGSASTLVIEYDPDFFMRGEALYDYVGKPLFGVLVGGLIPCAWLAWLFAKLLMREGRDDASFDPVEHDGCG